MPSCPPPIFRCSAPGLHCTRRTRDAVVGPGANGTAGGAAGRDALQKEEQGAGRIEQKIEHIRIEDSGARVDEVRYGGQTQSITVQPKANVPAYEVLPSNNYGRSPQGPAETGSGGNGPRVWNVLKF